MTEGNTANLKLIADVQQTIEQLRLVKKELKSVGDDSDSASKETARSFGDMAESVMKYTAALGASLYAMEKIVEASIAMERKLLSFDMLETANKELADMVVKTESLSMGMLRASDMAATMNAALIRGVPITAEKYEELIKVSTKLALAQNLGVEDVVDGFITGIARMSPAIMENTGIIVNAQAEYKAYALQIGKTADSLTDIEKKTALLNAMMDAGAEKVKEYGDISNNVHVKNIEKLQKVSNLWKTIKDGATTALVKVMDFGTSIGEGLADNQTKANAVLEIMRAQNISQSEAVELYEARNGLAVEVVTSEKEVELALMRNNLLMQTGLSWAKAMKVEIAESAIFRARMAEEEAQGTLSEESIKTAFGEFKLFKKKTIEEQEKFDKKKIANKKKYNAQRLALGLELASLEDKFTAKNFATVDAYVKHYNTRLKDAKQDSKEYTKVQLEELVLRAKAQNEIDKQTEIDNQKRIDSNEKLIAQLSNIYKEVIDAEAESLKTVAEKNLEALKGMYTEAGILASKQLEEEEKKDKQRVKLKEAVGSRIISASNAMYSAMLDDQEHSLFEMVGLAMKQAGGALVADGTKNILIAAGLSANPLMPFSGAALAAVGALEIGTGVAMGYAGKALAGSPGVSETESSDTSKEQAVNDRIKLDDEYKQETVVNLFPREEQWLIALDDSMAKIKGSI